MGANRICNPSQKNLASKIEKKNIQFQNFDPIWLQSSISPLHDFTHNWARKQGARSWNHVSSQFYLQSWQHRLREKMLAEEKKVIQDRQEKEERDKTTFFCTLSLNFFSHVILVREKITRDTTHHTWYVCLAN